MCIYVLFHEHGVKLYGCRFAGERRDEVEKRWMPRWSVMLDN